ncbi:hypothetical protein ACFUAC_19375 [Streptomyces sp. NPDC057148]|uniref:hypothetical protein n=1 Tax=unclassified Streptomyces TaxID=2593676 RepID=UPI00364500BE
MLNIHKLLPHGDDAKRLTRNALHFAEFFQKYEIKPPALEGKALLWGHCHQRATGGMNHDRQLLEGMGLDVENLQGGCCGLAGSWRFEDADTGREALHVAEIMKLAREHGAGAASSQPERNALSRPAPPWRQRVLRISATAALAAAVTAVAVRTARS